MPDEQSTVRPVRFSLPSLLLLPLLVSPLFLSAVFVRRDFQSHDQPSSATFFNLLACTVIYAAVFTCRSRHRVYQNGSPGRRQVLPAVWTGAWYGVLFMAQVFVPWLVAWVHAQARRIDFSIFDYLCLDYTGVLQMAAMLAGGMGSFGVVRGEARNRTFFR